MADTTTLTPEQLAAWQVVIRANGDGFPAAWETYLAAIGEPFPPIAICPAAGATVEDVYATPSPTSGYHFILCPACKAAVASLVTVYPSGRREYLISGHESDVDYWAGADTSLAK